MEFACQEATEVCLLKKDLNFIAHHNPLEEQQLGGYQFGKTVSNRKSKELVWRKKAQRAEKALNRLELGSGNVGKGLLGTGLVKKGTDEGSSGGSRSITDLPPVLISEILNCLDPKELGIVSCVSTTLCRIAAEHDVWKEYYCERWGLPIAKGVSPGLVDEKSWKELFVEREFRSRTFLGKYRPDFLSGHSDAVLTVFLLASAKLIFTAGYDSVVRVWDLEEGISVASSNPLGCTIRAVAADTRLLVAGGDGFIQGWQAVAGISQLFDLKGCQSEDSEFRLRGHEGPITCLSLDLTRIYSGSWDMSVRVWDRTLLKCVVVLRHSDWVWNLAPHHMTLASTSGSDVYIWDTSDGTLAAFIPQAHVGKTSALARSHAGDFLFTGGDDGAVHMFEIINYDSEDGSYKVATWLSHSAPVNSLAFEFPWLVSASADGTLALIDVRKLLKISYRSLRKHRNRRGSTHQATIEPPQRMLHGSGSSLFSVGIGADRIVCGGEEHTVKIWDFSQALERELRSRAQRANRYENRMRQRRLQTEMSSKSGRVDKCSAAAKKSPIRGDRSGVWHNKRETTGKVKA